MVCLLVKTANDLDAAIMSTSTSADGCCASYQLIQEREDADGDGVMEGEIPFGIMSTMLLVYSSLKHVMTMQTTPVNSPLPIPTMPTIVCTTGDFRRLVYGYHQLLLRWKWESDQ